MYKIKVVLNGGRCIFYRQGGGYFLLPSPFLGEEKGIRVSREQILAEVRTARSAMFPQDGQEEPFSSFSGMVACIKAIIIVRPKTEEERAASLALAMERRK